MVVTRKRSCSASETTSTGTPRAAKLKKQDDGGGGLTPRTTPRCVAASETPVTPRRTRRFTDSVAEAATSSPKTPRVKQKDNNVEAQTPKEAIRNKSSNDKAADNELLGVQQRKLVVRLRDLGNSTPQSPRSRRVSAGERDSQDIPVGTPTVSTPVRRSRRLSGSGVEDFSSQDTPSKKTSISRALGFEGKLKEENTNRQSILPVIEEDTEHLESKHNSAVSPRKDAEEVQGGKDKPDSVPTTDEAESDGQCSTLAKDEEPSPTAARDKIDGNETNIPVTVDDNVKGSIKDVPLENIESQERTEMETEDNNSSSNVSNVESKVMETAGNQDSTFSSKELQNESTELTKLNDTQENKTKSSKELEIESMELTDSNDTQENKTQSSRELEIESMELTESNDTQESKTESSKDIQSESTKLSKSNDTQENKTESSEELQIESIDPESSEDEELQIESIEPESFEKLQSESIEPESSEELQIESIEPESSEELQMESIELTESNDTQKDKTESSKLPNTCDIQESSQIAVINKESNAVDGKHTSSNTPLDENANKEKVDGMAGNKKVTKVIPELEKKIEQLRSIPRGRSVSGRWWKKEKQRFRSINKDATGKKSWSKKMQLKQWREDVLAKSAAIEAEKQKKKEDLKERQKLNKIRREENAKKSEVVQVIKDPRKIKKMKRKQLRYLETRDTTNM